MGHFWAISLSFLTEELAIFGQFLAAVICLSQSRYLQQFLIILGNLKPPLKGPSPYSHAIFGHIQVFYGSTPNKLQKKLVWNICKCNKAKLKHSIWPFFPQFYNCWTNIVSKKWSHLGGRWTSPILDKRGGRYVLDDFGLTARRGVLQVL